MIKILVIVAIVVAVAKFPNESITLGNKAIKAVVTVATGVYVTGKTVATTTVQK